MEITVQPLDLENRGKKLTFRYETEGFYDTVLQKTPEGWAFSFRLKPFSAPVEKCFEDRLLSGWLEEPSLFGAFVDGTLASYVETSHERWNNRLRISNILVEAPFRGMGVGRALFEQAENRAREVKARAVVLETQSCNVPAIRFYEKMGMGGIGCDLLAYSNEDISRGEVGLEMGKPLTV